MIRRSPAEQYIRYLIVHPDGYTNSHIRDILMEDQLDFIGNWYVDKLRSRIFPPEIFRPRDFSHKPSQKFLHSEGLFDFFHPSESVKTAYAIHKVPRVKELVEALIIGHTDYNVISEICNTACYYPCSAYSIQKYKTMFWDIDLLDATELRELFAHRRRMVSEHPDPEIRKMALSDANFYRDARVIAAGLPRTPMSSVIVMSKLGIVPINIDHTQLLKASMHTFIQRLGECGHSEHKSASFHARNWAGTVKDIAETLANMVKPEEQLHNQLVNIAIRTDVLEMRTIKEITAGEHTIEIQPEEQREEHEPGDSDEIVGGEGEDPPESGDGSGG